MEATGGVRGQYNNNCVILIATVDRWELFKSWILTNNIDDSLAIFNRMYFTITSPITKCLCLETAKGLYRKSTEIYSKHEDMIMISYNIHNNMLLDYLPNYSHVSV